MAFPELPDDRRARSRRYRGGAVDGGPDFPDDRRHSTRRTSRVDDADGTVDEQERLPGTGTRARGGRSDEERPARSRRAASDGQSVPDGGTGRRRARTVDDEPRHSPNGNGHPGAGSRQGGSASGPPSSNGLPPSNGRAADQRNSAANGYPGNGRSGNGHPGTGQSANGYPGDGYSDDGYSGNGHSGNGHPSHRDEPSTNGSRDGRPPADRLRDAYPFSGSGPDDAPRDEGRRRRRYLDERGPDEFGHRSAANGDREPGRPPAPAHDDGPRFADGRRPSHAGDAAYDPAGPQRPVNGNGRRPPAPENTGPADEGQTGRRRRRDDPDDSGPPQGGHRRLAPDPAGDRPPYRNGGLGPDAAGHSRAPAEPGPPPRPGDDPRATNGRAAPRRVPDPRGPDPRAQDPRFRPPGAEPDADGRPRRSEGNRPPSRPDAAGAPAEATQRVRRDDGPTRRVPAAYTAGEDAPGSDDDVDTRAVPIRRRRPASRPEEPPDDVSAGTADPTARPRAPGRRPGRPAEPPDPDEAEEYDRPDAEDEPFDDADDPRVGKRSGPVGVGGKLAALTARRSGTGDAGKKKSFWRELPLLLGVALVLTFLIQTFVAKVFVIPSGSMETTLHGCTGCTNDRVLVDKVTYNFTDIAPGDVVVFRGPENWSDSEYQLEQTSNPILRGLQVAISLIGFAPPDEQDFVKRVIAVGGQTVSCCDALNQVMVDGQPLDEPYIYYLPEAGPARQIPFGPITVPQGELWVMGDSRNNSADARAHGPVPEENVIGKVRMIVIPFDRFGWVDAVDPQTSATAAGPHGGLPGGTALALGMMGAFPLALSRRRSLAQAAEREWFVPVARRRTRWRRK